MSEKRGSNPRPQPWQGCALSTELFSLNSKRYDLLNNNIPGLFNIIKKRYQC